MPAQEGSPEGADSSSGAGGPLGHQTVPIPEGRSRAVRVALWAVVSLVTVVVVAVLAFVVLSLWGLWVYANHDRTAWIDDPVVAEAAEEACARMHSDLEDVPVEDDAPVAQQAAEIRIQNVVVLRLVEDVRDLGDRRLSRDMPSQLWLEDWESLVQARETYADDLVARGSPELVIPASDGVPITERMEEVMLDCAVPPALFSVPAPAWLNRPPRRPNQLRTPDE